MGQQIYYEELTPEHKKIEEFGRANSVIISIGLASLGINSEPSYYVVTDSEVSRDQLEGLGKLEEELKIKMELITSKKWFDSRDVAVSETFYLRSLEGSLSK